MFFLLLSTYAQADIDIPTDTETHLFGLGVSADYDKAQQFALGSINQKIITRVSSSVALKQVKVNAHATDTLRAEIAAKSNAINITNAKVVSNNQDENGKWWVILEVNKQNLAKSLLVELDRESSLLTKKYNLLLGQEGPNCWFETKDMSEQLSQLDANNMAYYGLSDDIVPVEKNINLITQFNSLALDCQRLNTYKLSLPNNFSDDAKELLVRSLQTQGYFVSDSDGLGEIKLKQRKKYNFFYDNHLYILTNEVQIIDDLGRIQKSTTFKVKGSSFDSKRDALEKALINLTKQLENKLI
jgi:hypothetical protein